MITEHDLDEAIAECIGQRSPNASTCIKLAAFYTIRRELYGRPEEKPEPVYSFSPGPPNEETISTVIISGGSDLAEAIRGKDQAEVWPVIDELMQTVQALYPRLYRSTMEELRGVK